MKFKGKAFPLFERVINLITKRDKPRVHEHKILKMNTLEKY